MLNYHYRKTTIVLDEKLKEHGFIRDEVSLFTPMFYVGIGHWLGYKTEYGLKIPITLKVYYLPATFLNKKFTDTNSLNIRPFADEPDNVFILSLCLGI